MYSGGTAELGKSKLLLTAAAMLCELLISWLRALDSGAMLASGALDSTVRVGVPRRFVVRLGLVQLMFSQNDLPITKTWLCLLVFMLSSSYEPRGPPLPRHTHGFLRRPFDLLIHETSETSKPRLVTVMGSQARLVHKCNIIYLCILYIYIYESRPAPGAINPRVLRCV